MILADVETHGFDKNSKPQKTYKLKKNNKQQSKGLVFSKLAKKTVGVGYCQMGKIAIIQTLINSDANYLADNKVKRKVKANKTIKDMSRKHKYINIRKNL